MNRKIQKTVRLAHALENGLVLLNNLRNDPLPELQLGPKAAPEQGHVLGRKEQVCDLQQWHQKASSLQEGPQDQKSPQNNAEGLNKFSEDTLSF
mmetsp:Transcript_19877/g.25782  ORF Transcript_19877/g.25782 Transcript_19877/m.25782 type:complete len:94 (-) Transcript_19877:1635-1916(-)